MNVYYAIPPAAVPVHDVLAAARAALPQADYIAETDLGIQAIFVTGTLTAPELADWQATVAAATADPASPWNVQATLTANIAGALVRLRQIKTQADALQGVANYGTGGAGNLNDLLAKVKDVGAAVGDLATDLLYLARLLTDQLDGTS